MNKTILFLLLPLCSFCQDYTVSKNANLYYAIPENKALKIFSGSDAAAVINGAISTLCPQGATGSGGGWIKIGGGVFFLNSEIVVNGWENTVNPFSQLIISGNGLSSQITQNTAGKNAIVVKNNAALVLRDLQVYAGNTAKSCLLADDNGAQEASWNRGEINNVLFNSNSTGYPALLLKNFFNLSVGLIHVFAQNNDAIVLSNTSSSVGYGNSDFKAVYANGGANYAGLRIINTYSNQGMSMLTFQKFECHAGKYGIMSTRLVNSAFNHIDLEGPFTTGISLANTREVSFRGGYIFSTTTGATAIKCAVDAGVNDFDLNIEGDSTITPVNDQQQYVGPNKYNLVLQPAINDGLIKIASANTPITYRMINGAKIITR